MRGEQSQAQTIIVDGNTPWVQQLEIWMLPHGFLRAAVRNNATVKTQTVSGKRYNVVTFTGQNKAAVNGYINDQNLVERVETLIDNPVLGDMPFEAVYSDYKEFGGVKFPTRIVQRQGGHPVFDLTVGDVRPNRPGRHSAAAGARRRARGRRRGRGRRRDRPSATPSEKLADGVYLILGGYASVVVEFKDHLAIVESGQNEARGEAVIAEAKRLVPNKPIRYIVNTHHHFDHSSGLRPLVAEGATIVTHQINKSFYERVFTAPRTLNPDRLARSPRKPTVDAMTDRKVMTDGNQTLELHHLRGSGHNEGIIVAYLPKERILIEADAYNPPADPAAPMPVPPSPYTVNLLENIERLRLEPARIIAVHYPADGRVVTKEELMKAAGRSGSTSQ